jgi:hypothetical protein
MLTNPLSFIEYELEELEYLITSEQWEDADVLYFHLEQFIHLFDAETLDKFSEWFDNIQYGLRYE